MGRMRKKLTGPAALLAPLVVSAALHSGTLFGIPAAYSWFQQQPATESSQTAPLAESINTSNPTRVKSLKQERDKYMSELLSKLRKGREIDFSDFFIKSEYLDRSIALAEKGETGPSEQSYRNLYNELVSNAKEFVKGSDNHFRELHKFFHTKVMRGYFKEKMSILDMLDSGWGNCRSSSQLFSSMVQDVVGIPQNFLIFDDHIASFINGRYIENTAHTWEDSNNGYDGCGAVVPGNLLVAGYLVKHGTSMESLPWSVQKFYKTAWKWGSQCEGRRAKNDFGAGSDGLPSIGINSGLVVPDFPIPNPKYKIKKERFTERDIVDYARAIRAVSFLAERYGRTSRTAEGGIADVIDAPQNLDWIELIDFMKDKTPFSRMLAYYPREYRCSYKFDAFDEAWALTLMRSFRKYQGMDLERRLCSKYSLSAKSAPLDTLVSDFPYNFCHKEKDVMIRRYSEERFDLNKDGVPISLKQFAFSSLAPYFIVRLGNFADPKDFEFFNTQSMSGMRQDIRIYASFARTASDWVSSCRGGPPSDGIPNEDIRARIVMCHDKDAIWHDIETYNEGTHTRSDIRGLTFLRGPYISQEQAEYLRKLGHSFMGEEVRRFPLLKISRILAEYADTLPDYDIAKSAYLTDAESFAREAARMFNNKKEMLESEDMLFFEIPPRYLEYFVDFGRDIDYLNTVSSAFACASKALPKDLIGLLKGAVTEDRLPIDYRIRAAIILWDAGVDPLSPDSP